MYTYIYYFSFTFILISIFILFYYIYIYIYNKNGHAFAGTKPAVKRSKTFHSGEGRRGRETYWTYGARVRHNKTTPFRTTHTAYSNGISWVTRNSIIHTHPTFHAREEEGVGPSKGTGTNVEGLIKFNVPLLRCPPTSKNNGSKNEAMAPTTRLG